MNETNPRWGDRGREGKALAILEAIVSCQGSSIIAGHWVDVGCGGGRIAASLADHVQCVTGIDPEKWAQWTEFSSSRKNLSFTEGRCDDSLPPVPCESVDVAICNQVYEHVGNPEVLVRNISAILKPGGCCYFAGPNLLWPFEPHVSWPFVHWLPRKFARNLMSTVGSRKAKDLDAFSAGVWSLRAWFAAAGLEHRSILDVRVTNELLRRGVPEWLSRLIGRLMKAMTPISPGFIFLLVKKSDPMLLSQSFHASRRSAM